MTHKVAGVSVTNVGNGSSVCLVMACTCGDIEMHTGSMKEAWERVEVLMKIHIDAKGKT